jgi:hypothetical protein
MTCKIERVPTPDGLVVYYISGRIEGEGAVSHYHVNLMRVGLRELMKATASIVQHRRSMRRSIMLNSYSDRSSIGTLPMRLYSERTLPSC